MSVSVESNLAHPSSVVEQGKGEVLSPHLACHEDHPSETGTHGSPQWFIRVVKIAEEERTRTRMTSVSWSSGKMDRSTLKSPRCLGMADWKLCASMVRSD